MPWENSRCLCGVGVKSRLLLRPDQARAYEGAAGPRGGGLPPLVRQYAARHASVADRGESGCVVIASGYQSLVAGFRFPVWRTARMWQVHDRIIFPILISGLACPVADHRSLIAAG